MRRPGRSFRRRSATAVGIYAAAVLGFLGQLLAARSLGPHEFGLFAIVFAATGFFQSLLDVTVEEAAIKYGFRYTTAGAWGKLRRLLGRALAFKAAGGVLAALALIGLAPLAHGLFGASGLRDPLLVAAFLPLAQAAEGPAGVAIVLRGRYDIRSWFLTLSMALRCLALGIGSRYGVTETMLGVVLAQVVATAAVSGAGWLAFRRFPQTPAERLAGDRREILSFVGQSTAATTVLSLRGTFAPMLLGIVTTPIQVGYFRTAMSPQQALASLSAPARLILLTEQTRDWERGRHRSVLSGVRRYTLGVGVLMTVLLPPILWLMPDLIRVLYGRQYVPAADAARLMFAAGALLAVIGWTKSLPVSIGRPGLRILTHGLETALLVPLVVVFGAAWGATGASAAFLVATVAFAALWAVVLVRIRRGLPQLPLVPDAIEEAFAP
jgi:O-antigen/teichoic acid export membrane protein